jgi:hypothetical protein
MSDETAKVMARIYRDAIRVGLTDGQATGLMRLVYTLKEGYTWKIPEDSGILEHRTRVRNAVAFPHGKDAEYLARVNNWHATCTYLG